MTSASAVAPMPTVAVAARRRLAQPVAIGALPPGSEGAPIIYPGEHPLSRLATRHSSHSRSFARPPGKTPPKLAYPDIGGLAKWSVSSFKFGFGPECLTDDDPETFWQYVSLLLATRPLAPPDAHAHAAALARTDRSRILSRSSFRARSPCRSVCRLLAEVCVGH